MAFHRFGRGGGSIYRGRLFVTVCRVDDKPANGDEDGDADNLAEGSF
jgi:hypothetical protein